MTAKQQAQHHPHKTQTTESSKTARPAREQQPHLRQGLPQPADLSRQDVLAMQKTVGNQAVAGLLGAGTNHGPESRDASGLPLALKTSVEQLSGVSLDDVRVHYNSSEPKAVGALAYTRGTDIHLRPGQEQHLAHETWHVVQQKQGRVAPTMQMKSALINNDNTLEKEADSMGEKALQMTRQGAEHGKGCGCGACSATQARPAARSSFPLPAAVASQAGGSPAMGVIQRRCEKCGADDHKTSRCPQTKAQRDEHQDKVKAFQSAKRSTLASMREKEKEGGRGGATEAFKKKHVTRSGQTLEKSSKEVAETRSWGGGRESGRSTVVDIKPEELQQESRFAMESLKFSEAEVGEDSVKPRFGVTKPTKFNYKTQSSTVQSDGSGKRSVQQEEPELAKPVLALQGQDVHHLHGVDDVE